VRGLSFAVSVSVVGVFLTSGAAKVLRGTFTSDLANYRLLPPSVVVSLAVVLPWLEIAVGTALLVGLWPPVFLGTAAVMLFAFTVAIIINLLRGRRVACGCRGAQTPISWQLVGTNAAMITAIIAAEAIWAAPVLPTLAGTQLLPPADALAVVIALIATALGLRLAGAWSRASAVLRAIDGALVGPA